MVPANYKINEVSGLVHAFPSAVPSTSTGLWASLANFERAAVIILVKNATTVTGSAITFNQAVDISGTSSKALGFTTMDANLDTSAASTGDTLTATAVSSNTFTTLTTNSKNAIYVVNFKATDLDVANGFKTFQIVMATAVAATLSVLYLLYGPKYAGVSVPAAVV